jgi:release factor glutamine methyltransferase
MEWLKSAGADEPDAKARVIVAEALGISLGDVFLYTHVDEAALKHIEEMTLRCVSGEPVEYVTGRAYFRHITLSVSPDVLIPRQETELVAGEAISLIRANGYKKVLDLCTGSGCIAISIQTETGIETDACDICEKALLIAKRNAKGSDADVRFFLSDVFASVTGTYDMIVSNPPYVSEIEYETLDKGVRLYEPRNALVAGDGLAFYRIIAGEAGQYLHKGGALVLEIGAAQGKDVAKLLISSGFNSVTCGKDYTGRDRIVTARRV